MRFVIDRNVVEMRSKGVQDERFTKKQTMHTMNWLSIVFDKAAEKFEEEGAHGLAQNAREDSTALFQKLCDYHYYD